MKKIYDAAHLPEAQLIVDLLRRQGMRVHLLNQNASGAMGDIPYGVAGPQVWLEDDHRAPDARRLIAEYHAATAHRLERTCAECGERNPETFEVCWNCGRPFPA